MPIKFTALSIPEQIEEIAECFKFGNYEHLHIWHYLPGILEISTREARQKIDGIISKAYAQAHSVVKNYESQRETAACQAQSSDFDSRVEYKNALILLGLILVVREKGWGNENAKSYFDKAMDEGHPFAFICNGIHALHGEKYDEAYKYFEIASKLENKCPTADSYLGYMYQNGIGVGRTSEQKAIQLFKTAKDLNCIDAMVKLAHIKRKKGQDRSAKEYYKSAIEYGHSDAMLGLAFIYIEEERYSDASSYLMQAVRFGNNAAMYHLALLHIEGLIEPADTQMAGELLACAAKCGHENAQDRLASLVETGLYIESKKSEYRTVWKHIEQTLMKEDPSKRIELTKRVGKKGNVTLFFHNSSCRLPPVSSPAIAAASSAVASAN